MELSNRKKMLKSKGIKNKSSSKTESCRRENSILKRVKRESKNYGKKIADEAHQEFLRKEKQYLDDLIYEMEEKYKRLLNGQAASIEKIMQYKMQERINGFTERCLAILENFSHNKKNLKS